MLFVCLLDNPACVIRASIDRICLSYSSTCKYVRYGTWYVNICYQLIRSFKWMFLSYRAGRLRYISCALTFLFKYVLSFESTHVTVTLEIPFLSDWLHICFQSQIMSSGEYSVMFATRSPTRWTLEGSVLVETSICDTRDRGNYRLYF